MRFGGVKDPLGGVSNSLSTRSTFRVDSRNGRNARFPEITAVPMWMGAYIRRDRYFSDSVVLVISSVLTGPRRDHSSPWSIETAGRFSTD
jgi:hypothetical protein